MSRLRVWRGRRFMRRILREAQQTNITADEYAALQVVAARFERRTRFHVYPFGRCVTGGC